MIWLRPALGLLLPALLAGCSGPSDGSPTATPSRTLPATGPATTTAAPSASPSPDDPLSPRPAIESPAPLGQPVCRSSAVTVTDADAVITDRVEQIYVLRTTGRACQLEGFPTITFLDADGTALDVRTSRAATPPTPVTLSPATSLSFTLVTGRTGSCTPVAALQVVLPGTTGSLRVETTLNACGTVEIGPVGRLQDDEDEGAGG